MELAFQGIRNDIAALRTDRADDKRVLGSIEKKVSKLSDDAIRNEETMRRYSGEHEGFKRTLGEHEKFINQEKGGRTVWHWLRALFVAIGLLLLGAQLNRTHDLDTHQGEMSSDIKDHGGRINRLEDRVFGISTQEKK